MPKGYSDYSARLFGAGVALASFIIYLTIGFRRYSIGWSGNYDLGIFAQAAKGWANLEGPLSPIKGGSLFADHFSPISALFGVGWFMWPDPRSLIVMQALALAMAGWLMASYAWRTCGNFVAICTAGMFMFSSPFIAAARFDVHETALGAPFLALFCIFIREDRRRLMLVAAVGVMAIKEDMGAAVIAGAVSYLLIHRRWQGFVQLLTLGCLGTVVALWTISHVGSGTASPYLHYLTSGFEPDVKRLMPIVLCILISGAFVRDPLILIAIPTLLWRVLSSNPQYWALHG